MVGAGAIGGALGGLLARSGVDLRFVARGETAARLRENGVELRFPDRVEQVRVPVDEPGWVGVTSEDLVIVATMTQHTAAAVDGLAPDVPVLSAQNGLACFDALAGRPTLAATLWMPVERRAPGVLALMGWPTPGFLLVGDWPGRVSPLAAWVVDALGHAGLRAEAEPRSAEWARAKLLNNLGGIVVALCDDPPVDVIAAARSEARAVWRATGDAWHEPEALVARAEPFEARAVDGVLRMGSTRAALARGERLETGSLHGPIVAAGLRTGVPTPVNSALVALATQAHVEGWRPGCFAAAELRMRVGS